MKKIVFTVAIIVACLSAKSQFTNYKLTGTIQMDQPTDIFLDFRKDTVDAVIVASGEMLEKMLYTVKDSTVTFQKISGQSDCGTDVVGKYKFNIKDDHITLSLIEDICYNRAGALDNTVWTRQKKYSLSTQK